MSSRGGTRTQQLRTTSIASSSDGASTVPRSSVPEREGQQSRRTTMTTITKVSTEESLNFCDKDDDWLDNVVETDYKSRRIMTALELAVIFEDCVDTLTALSNAVAAPTLEIRTVSSIIEDDFFNRPRYGGDTKNAADTPLCKPKTKFSTAIHKPPLPPISLKGSYVETTSSFKSRISEEMKSKDGTLSPGSSEKKEKETAAAVLSKVKEGGGLELYVEKKSGSFDTMSGNRKESDDTRRLSTEKEEDEEQEGEGNEEEGAEKVGQAKEEWYLLKQFYQRKIYKRTWQSNKETPLRTFDEMVKNAGLKKSNPSHKLQTDMANIKFMMADIFNELVQKGTYESLAEYLAMERQELNRLSVAAKRLHEKRTYSRKLRAEINETRQSKTIELQMLKLLEHQIEDQGQELRVRTAVEAVYSQNFVEAKCKESLKRSDKPPMACEKVKKGIRTWMDIEESAHMAMKKYLNHRISEICTTLDHWVEKYEVDKERLLADLDELKEERAKKKAHRMDLEEKIRLWMPVLRDNRRVMRIRQDEEDFFKQCCKAATKIAARWKGYMVRAGIGRFAQKLT